MESQVSLIIGWVVMLALIITIIFISVVNIKKLLKAEKEKEKISYKASIDAEERQKEKISRNFHDEVIPMLTALLQNIEIDKRDLSKRTFIPDFDNYSRILQQCITDIKDISRDLIPTSFFTLGFLKALEQYILQLNNKAVIAECDAKISEQEIVYSKDIKLNIYRISLEILRNLTKHANYTYLRIVIDKNETTFFINFKHNGSGVSNEEISAFTNKSEGLGLKSLRARLSIINGNVTYKKEERLIILSIPIYE